MPTPESSPGVVEVLVLSNDPHEHFVLRLRPTASIDELKASLRRRCGSSAHHMRILSENGTRELADKSTLSQNGLDAPEPTAVRLELCEASTASGKTWASLAAEWGAKASHFLGLSILQRPSDAEAAAVRIQSQARRRLEVGRAFALALQCVCESTEARAARRIQQAARSRMCGRCNGGVVQSQRSWIEQQMRDDSLPKSPFEEPIVIGLLEKQTRFKAMCGGLQFILWQPRFVFVTPTELCYQRIDHRTRSPRGKLTRVPLDALRCIHVLDGAPTVLVLEHKGAAPTAFRFNAPSACVSWCEALCAAAGCSAAQRCASPPASSTLS